MEALTINLVIFAIVAAFTPGPNNIMIMASGLNHGVKASLPHFFGICFGFPAMLLAAGFGLGYLFERYLWLHSGIQVVGILYLLYLAWVIARSAPSDDAMDVAPTQPLTFFQAALFQWVNPKAWVMGTGAISAYTTVGGDISVQILVIIMVFFSMTFPSAGVWMVFGVALRTLLTERKHQRNFNIGMSLLLVASIAPIAVELITEGSGH